MPESNRALPLMNVHLCESIFYQRQRMHPMGINLSFSSCNASPHVLRGLECFENLFRNLYSKKRVDFALMACRITNGAYLLNISYRINDSINVSKLHII